MIIFPISVCLKGIVHLKLIFDMFYLHYMEKILECFHQKP